jgi:hypothetical protein
MVHLEFDNTWGAGTTFAYKIYGWGTYLSNGMNTGYYTESAMLIIKL